jgi:hypothetical protein
MPWLAAIRADHGPATSYPAAFRFMVSLAAASCWLYAIPITAASISLVDTALRMHELIAAEEYSRPISS